MDALKPTNRPGVNDALQDSAYLAGAKAGWNAAQSDDPNAAYARLVASREGYLKPLVATPSAPVEQEIEGLVAEGELLDQAVAFAEMWGTEENWPHVRDAYVAAILRDRKRLTP